MIPRIHASYSSRQSMTHANLITPIRPIRPIRPINPIDQITEILLK